VKQQRALFFFALQVQVPELSPVALFVQYLSALAFTMYLQSHSDHQMQSTWFTPLLQRSRCSSHLHRLQLVAVVRSKMLHQQQLFALHR
jgi:hypothetical protein